MLQIPREVFNELILPRIHLPLPLVEESTPNISQFQVISASNLAQLWEAHQLMEKVSGLNIFGRVNKYFHTLCKKKINLLTTQLNEKIAEIKTCKVWRKCLETNRYPLLVKFFFSRNPLLLQHENLYKRNLLHAAVDYSPPFIPFIIKLNQENNLNLLMQKDKFGRTPLHQTGSAFVHSIRKKSIEYFFHSNISFEKEIFASLKAMRNLQEICEVIDLFLAHNTNLNYQNEKGETALHQFAQALQCTHFLALKEKGAKLSIIDHEGKTPLQILIDRFRASPKKFFHEQSVINLGEKRKIIDLLPFEELTVKDDAMETLIYVMGKSPRSISKEIPLDWIKSLIARIEDESEDPTFLASFINSKNLEKETILHFFAKNLNFSCLFFLLEKGGDLTLRDSKGNTPIDLLKEIYYQKIDFFFFGNAHNTLLAKQIVEFLTFHQIDLLAEGETGKNALDRLGSEFPYSQRYIWMNAILETLDCNQKMDSLLRNLVSNSGFYFELSDANYNLFLNFIVTLCKKLNPIPLELLYVSLLHPNPKHQENTLDVLITYNVDINITNSQLETILHILSRQLSEKKVNFFEGIALLLKKGANPNCQDVRKVTPLEILMKKYSSICPSQFTLRNHFKTCILSLLSNGAIITPYCIKLLNQNKHSSLSSSWINETKDFFS